MGVTALCRKELPIRLAQRIMQLENLPLGLPNMPTIKQVRKAAAVPEAAAACLLHAACCMP